MLMVEVCKGWYEGGVKEGGSGGGKEGGGETRSSVEMMKVERGGGGKNARESGYEKVGHRGGEKGSGFERGLEKRSDGRKYKK